MKRLRNCNIFYDERQAIERGRAFRNGYITLALAMLLCFLIRDCFEWNPIDDYSMFLFCIWTSLVVVSVNLILNNAYDGIYEGRNALAAWIMGFAGTVCLVGEAVRGVKGKFTFYNDFGTLFSGIGLITIFSVYMVKRSHDAKQEKTEDPGKNIS